MAFAVLLFAFISFIGQNLTEWKIEQNMKAFCWRVCFGKYVNNHIPLGLFPSLFRLIRSLHGNVRVSGFLEMLF